MTSVTNRLAALLGAVALASVVTVVMPGPAAAAPTPCTDVLVLGARGSGQSATGDAYDAGTGLGPQVQGVIQRVQQQAPGVAMRVQAVTYEAHSVQLAMTDPDAYFAGLEKGVRAVRQAMLDAARQCPDQRTVLVGYSQGAMVMHRALQDLVADGDATERHALARLDGAILLADGDRVANDRTTNHGSARRSTGISWVVAEGNPRDARLPKRLRARVHSVCERRDLVCDAGRGIDVLRGGIVHTGGYSGTPAVTRAADAVAARVRG